MNDPGQERSVHQLAQSLLIQNLTFDKSSHFLDITTRLLVAYKRRHIVDLPSGSESILGILPSKYHLVRLQCERNENAKLATHSGLSISAKATCGFFAPVKVDSSVGRAARTSGHHAVFVAGSLDARKAMKNVSVAEGNARSATALGKVKF